VWFTLPMLFATMLLLSDATRALLLSWLLPHAPRDDATCMGAERLGSLCIRPYRQNSRQSVKFPKLAEMGRMARMVQDASAKNATTYSAADLRSLVAYAADRGVRVLAEFDLPGHGGWHFGMPELCLTSCPHVLDVTKDAVYVRTNATCYYAEVTNCTSSAAATMLWQCRCCIWHLLGGRVGGWVLACSCHCDWISSSAKGHWIGRYGCAVHMRDGLLPWWHVGETAILSEATPLLTRRV
jgi:hypothetical protein